MALSRHTHVGLSGWCSCWESQRRAFRSFLWGVGRADPSSACGRPFGSILFIVVGLILAALLLCLVKDAFESGLIPVAAAMAAVSSLFVGRLASRIVLIPYLLEFLMRWIAKNHDEAEKKKNAK